jgi:hypothetical protein
MTMSRRAGIRPRRGDFTFSRRKSFATSRACFLEMLRAPAVPATARVRARADRPIRTFILAGLRIAVYATATPGGERAFSWP